MVGVSGTPFYMSPEQWEPVPQDSRTDQYSLAATVYHLLSDTRVFESVGRVTGALRSAVLNDVPQRISGVSDAVWNVLARGLSKSPSDRYESCAAFSDALAQAAHPTRRSGRFTWLYVLGAACLAIGAVGYGLRDRGSAAVGESPPGEQQVGAVASAEQAMKYFALIIGINKYQAEWPTLKNAVNDARRIESLLQSDYVFEEITALYDEQATTENILAELERIAIEMTPNDCVLVYHAGHGEVDETAKEGFWIPYDGLPIAENGRRNSSWVAN